MDRYGRDIYHFSTCRSSVCLDVAVMPLYIVQLHYSFSHGKCHISCMHIKMSCRFAGPCCLVERLARQAALPHAPDFFAAGSTLQVKAAHQPGITKLRTALLDSSKACSAPLNQSDRAPMAFNARCYLGYDRHGCRMQQVLPFMLCTVLQRLVNPCLMAPCCCCRCFIHFHCPYPAAEAVSSFVCLQAADAIMHTITSRQTSMLAVSATTLCSMLSLLPRCSVRTGGAVQQLYCATVVASLTCRTTERLGLSCMVHSRSCAKAAESKWSL
jgi:hypothetical protein